MAPQPAQRGGSAKSSAQRAQVRSAAAIIRALSPDIGRRTSAGVAVLFDMKLRAHRRDRAARLGPELFLFERVFADCLERLALVQRRFGRALLIGCPDPNWPARLGERARTVETRDPGPLFAEAAGGNQIVEDSWMPEPGAFDLIVALGTLDTVNHLPLALRLIIEAMKPDALLIGAMSGGDTLPRLRAAMRAADAILGAASPHVHPRVEAAAVAPLLEQAGFVSPVVDVDRVPVAYPSLDRLVADLRRMGVTNVLEARSRRGLSRAARNAALAAFRDGDRTVETFEIVHFTAWKPSPRTDG